MSDHNVITYEELYESFLDAHDAETDDVSDDAFDKWVLSQLERGALVETENGNYIFL